MLGLNRGPGATMRQNEYLGAQACHDLNAVEAASTDGQLPRRLNRQEAARFLTEAGLPIAASTLAKKAVQGSGPPFRIGNGRALYDTVDLREWAEAQLGPKLTSTAQRKVVSTGGGRA
jgi:hypothetical protein